MIQALEIDNDYKKQGLGSRLLSYAVNQLGAKQLTVRKSNEPAINLYKKAGFEIKRMNDFGQYVMVIDKNIDLSKMVDNNPIQEVLVSNPNMDGINDTSSNHTFDENDSKVTEMAANTRYTMWVYLGGTDSFHGVAIGNGDNITIYYANVRYASEADRPVEGPIKQGDTQKAMPTYHGDATAHGFEADTFLQYMVTETTDNVWAAEPNSGKTREQLAAKIYGEAGKYVTIKFATSEDIASDSVFYVWGLLDGVYTQNGGLNFTSTTFGRILDVNGSPVSSIAKNTVYNLEHYIEKTNTYKVSNLVGKGMEMYFAPDSITCSDESMEVRPPETSEPESSEPETSEPEVEVAPIVSGETTSTALSVYEGSVTDLGFAEGTTVYQLVSADTWNDRVKIATDSTYKYLDVQFIVSEGPWDFTIWVCGPNGMLDGSYLVAELGDGTQHATFGNGYAIHYPNQGGSGGNTKIQVFDANGNAVIGNRPNGTLYTLRVW